MLSEMYRVVINGNASVFVTGRQILNGVGDLIKFNDAVKQCFQALVNQRKQEIKPSGLAGNWNGYNIQIDLQ